MPAAFSVLIAGGESVHGLFVAHCLAPFPGVKLHVLSSNPWAPVRFSRYCQTCTVKQTGLDDNARLQALEEVVKKNKIDVFLPIDSSWISLAIANRAALATFVAVPPLPDQRSFALARNKWLLAQFMEEHNILGPRTILATLDDQFDRQLQDLEFPVLLKPVTASGGEGIERFDTPADLRRYLERRNPDEVRGKFIVQALRPGFVVGVNVLARNGQLLATTMQRGIIPNTQKFAPAAAIQFIREERFHAAALQLISALNWSGFANLDTLYDSQDGQLKILEINARFWGSLRGSMVAGVSFPYLACLAALNVPFPIPDYQLVRYVHPKTAIKEGFLRLVGRNREKDFSFRETGLRFLVADPLAEAVRAVRQEVT